jgi:hypothetical protein
MATATGTSTMHYEKQGRTWREASVSVTTVAFFFLRSHSHIQHLDIR